MSVPTYTAPEASSFDLFGLKGSYDKANNTYSVSGNDLTDANSIMSNLIKSLGSGNVADSDYTKTYMNELLKLSQPATENALIGRGLGGSTVYKDALTDLITKASVQSILGGQQYQQNNYNMLSDYLNTANTNGMNLLQLLTQTDLAKQGLAQNLYTSTLPLKSTYNSGKNYSGLGSLLGAGLLGGASLLIPGSGIGLAGLSGSQMTGLGALGGGLLGGAF